MLCTNNLLYFALVALASSEVQAISVGFWATFDELAPSNNTASQSIGLYQGLDYRGVKVVRPGQGGILLSGVNPQSSPNVGAYDSTTAVDGLPQLTLRYPTSVYTSFILSSFYFGCVLGPPDAIASVAVGCNVTAIGYYRDREATRNSFKFVPDSPGAVQKMARADLERQFIGIDTLHFETDYAAAGVGSTFLDNIEYSNSYGSPPPPFTSPVPSEAPSSTTQTVEPTSAASVEPTLGYPIGPRPSSYVGSPPGPGVSYPRSTLKTSTSTQLATGGGSSAYHVGTPTATASKVRRDVAATTVPSSWSTSAVDTPVWLVPDLGWSTLQMDTPTWIVSTVTTPSPSPVRLRREWHG
ncbi:uncharacterized protein JN550_003711 [Neoarthrinium moseri]|uniref:uncharacterized protein n=1 Tax=Neoarthrinium moseri TaxID=1658444 RepID=UPI001FDDEEA1|nr:uncharacterized protein JN550_003711 [Neoarthrinium moseri]KAI1872837.1 hypothetical protein JN550_003711 [Neoarthrinium moseri]